MLQIIDMTRVVPDEEEAKIRKRAVILEKILNRPISEAFISNGSVNYMYHGDVVFKMSV